MWPLQSGYYPSDDDLRWWQFGDSTLNALKTFQVGWWAGVMQGDAAECCSQHAAILLLQAAAAAVAHGLSFCTMGACLECAHPSQASTFRPLCPPPSLQACSGLPESGVADPRTWCALLGADASPAVLDTLRSENSDDEDMANSDRVWLMGEQRWEDRSRVKRK